MGSGRGWVSSSLTKLSSMIANWGTDPRAVPGDLLEETAAGEGGSGSCGWASLGLERGRERRSTRGMGGWKAAAPGAGLGGSACDFWHR